MPRASPILLSALLLLIAANTCYSFSNLRHVAYEDASSISAVSGVCCTGSRTNACCANDEVCERGECISKDIVNSGRIIRFELDRKKNGLLLRNLCNGMQRNNTATLTYSGQLSQSEKAAKRRAAGCVDGYCSALINKGSITSDLDSCDEFPPASSNEGGDTLPANKRAISCIPGFQNCIQGAMFRSLYKRTGIQAGQKFVISIDCEEVLESTVRRELRDDSFYEPKRMVLKTRDTISINRTTNSNDTFNLPNGSATFIFAPFGDLNSGTYTAQAQVVSGSTANAVVIANEGDPYTNDLQSLAKGQTLQISFSLENSDIGLGIAFSGSNDTVIQWSLEGISSSKTATASSTSSTASASGSPKPSGVLPLAPSFMHWWGIVIGVIMLQLLS